MLWHMDQVNPSQARHTWPGGSLYRSTIQYLHQAWFYVILKKISASQPRGWELNFVKEGSLFAKSTELAGGSQDFPGQLRLPAWSPGPWDQLPAKEPYALVIPLSGKDTPTSKTVPTSG